jgi:hypothetical protein
MPPAEKDRMQALLNELPGIVKTLPQPVAVQLAGKIASRLMESSQRPAGARPRVLLNGCNEPRCYAIGGLR